MKKVHTCLSCGSADLHKQAKRCRACNNIRQRAAYTGKNNPFYGHKHSIETRSLMKNNHADVTGEKNPNYGKHLLAGENHPNYGKHLSEVTKNNISAATLGRKDSLIGKANKTKAALKRCQDPEYVKRITANMIMCTPFVDRSMEKNSNWQGGKSFELYSLGWTKTCREQIRHRDGYKCQVCGVPEVECKRKLHVHHIDYDKKNIGPNNLISLCNSCHVKTNYRREFWQLKLTKNAGGVPFPV